MSEAGGVPQAVVQGPEPCREGPSEVMIEKPESILVDLTSDPQELFSGFFPSSPSVNKRAGTVHDQAVWTST